MVRLASIHHKGETKLVAQVDDDGYVDLTSIAPHVRAFLEKESAALEMAKERIANGPKIPAAEARLLIPLDPSTCG